MACLRPVEESKSVRLYREWSTARQTSREAATDLGTIVKNATEELNMSKKAIRLAFDLKRQDAVKVSAFLRDFDQLREELGLQTQTELEDAIKNTPPAA